MTCRSGGIGHLGRGAGSTVYCVVHDEKRKMAWPNRAERDIGRAGGGGKCTVIAVLLAVLLH